MLFYTAEAYVFFPGGFGTLDEFFEIVTLVQTQRISRFPLVLFGSDYWEGLAQWMKAVVGKSKYIGPTDMELFTITDEVPETVEVILDYRRRVGIPDRIPEAFA